MGADDLIRSGQGAARGLFFADGIQLALYFVMDMDRNQLRVEAREIADSDELRMRRAEKLQVAVTENDFVLLDARAEVVPEDEIARIPRREVTGVRLLDQRG